jgi:hypothetical protein
MSRTRIPLLGLALATAGLFALAATAQQPNGVVQASQTIPAKSSDRGSQLITEAKSSFARVKDYMGTLVKEERVNGRPQPEQYISFRIREQPFSVHLKWTSPKQFDGQEAVYVAGKNDNKMRAKGSGLSGMVGFVSIDPTDPRAMKDNRHGITETGIGHLIERLSHGCELDRRFSPYQVETTIRDFMFQQKQCTGLETVHKVNNGQFYCYRTVVYFDKQTKLPIRFEAYDWPTKSAPGGEKIECYSYIDLKFNIGLTDAAFGL